MQIKLNEIEFENDVFETGITDTEYLRFVYIDEWFVRNNVEIKKDCIVIFLVNDTKSVKISNIIGLKNGRFEIKSDNKELIGQVVDNNNRQYCTLEIEDA